MLRRRLLWNWMRLLASRQHGRLRLHRTPAPDQLGRKPSKGDAPPMRPANNGGAGGHPMRGAL